MFQRRDHIKLSISLLRPIVGLSDSLSRWLSSVGYFSGLPSNNVLLGFVIDVKRCDIF
jgi:hypothetical protein